MSKVAISGNASGTGTFTIQAPNSNTDRVLSLPDEAGTVLTSGTDVANFPSGFANGITEADEFRLTTDTATADDNSTGIMTSLERPDHSNFGKIGTGMSESSGVFTFPSTGIWRIEIQYRFSSNGNNARHLGAGMLLSTDSGSNYSDYDGLDAVQTFINRPVATTYAGACTTALLDVTNASTFRVKFYGRSSDSSNLSLSGNTSQNRTKISFIRLGDT